MKLTRISLETFHNTERHPLVIPLTVAFLAIFLWMPSAMAQAPQPDWAFRPPTSTGPAVGQKIPPFRAPDQNGKMQDFDSIKGPNGAAVYFMRSADW